VSGRTPRDSDTAGSDGLGRLDAGLVFLAFVRDPRTHVVPVQERIARTDALSEYVRHTGSALFAVPPGLPAAGTFVGEALVA
jgi:deferrochelatase/peroxidase EfeB